MLNIKSHNINTITLFLLLCLPFAAKTQSIYGVVSDSGNKPLPYVNIGIVGKNVGTVTDENGEYALLIDNSFINDTVRFSMVGHKPKSLLVSDMISKSNNKIDVILRHSTIELAEVVVRASKYKERNKGKKIILGLGNFGFGAGFNTDALGNEAGRKFTIKDKVLLSEFRFYIAKSTYDSLLFRMNIYSVKDNLPFENLLKNNVIINTDIKKGWVYVDLLEYDILAEEDIIVTLEWIKDFKTKGTLTFGSSLGYPAYYRPASQGKWSRFMMGGLAYAISMMVIE